MLQPLVYPQQLITLMEPMVAALAASLAAWPQRTRPPHPFDLGAAIIELTLSLTVQTFAGAALPGAQESASLFRTHTKTAHALVWTFHFLTHQPTFQQRVHQEVERVLGGQIPTFADLADLTTTTMLLHEALRHTSSPWPWAGEIDNTLPPAVQLSAALQQVVHQRPSHWHDSARCLAARGPAIHHDLALLAGQLVLAMVLQRYELASLPQDTYSQYPFFGPWVVLRKRT